MSSQNSTFAIGAAASLPDLALKCSTIEEAKNYCLNNNMIEGTDMCVGRWKNNIIVTRWCYRSTRYVVEHHTLLGIRIIQ